MNLVRLPVLKRPANYALGLNEPVRYEGRERNTKATPDLTLKDQGQPCFAEGISLKLHHSL